MVTPLRKIIQFWDKPELPDEIGRLIESWRADPRYEHHLFDYDRAAGFIQSHFGSELADIFSMCGVPAMQADFFRYCALFVLGGCYLDADTERVGDLDSLVSGCETGLLMKRQERVANDFIYVREPGSGLLKYCIETATTNIRLRKSNNVWEVTGPGIMTAAYNSPSRDVLFAGFDFAPVQKVRQIVAFRHNLEYKTQSEDWRISQASHSIYREPKGRAGE